MKLPYCLFFAALLTSAQALADLPAPVQNVDGEIISAQQLAISASAQNKLKTQLKSSVFLLYAKQPRMHDLIQTGTAFDGAAVAIAADAVKDIVNKDDLVELPAPPEPKQHHSSMFNANVARASSHFAKREEQPSEWSSQRQFYLTTADWLTNSNELELDVFGQRIKARLDYRDDAQNVAVISTQHHNKIVPAEIYSAENPIPGMVFILLSPNSIYENLTTHVLNVTQEHLYGTTNLTARNGYPLFTASGQLAGLVVSPDQSKTNANVVHSKLLDRALHPQKYSRTKTEEIKLEEY